MSVFTRLGVDIAAPLTVAGAPRQISPAEFQAWMTEAETLLNAIGTNGGSIYETRALLFADLAHAANTLAWVVADTTTAYNGIYQKSGASGSGSWTKKLDLPYSFVRATDAGGTANAIAVTTTVPVSSSMLILLPIAITNTSPMVTVSFNGATPLTVKTQAGNAPAVGGLVSGSVLAGAIEGSNFRLMSDQASAAIQAAAEAALASIIEKYLGAHASDAAATSYAGTPATGALYWNTADEKLKVWNGSAWVAAAYSGSVLTHSSDVGDGGTSYTLDSSAQATNTIVTVNGLRQTNFTLVDGALVFDTVVPFGVAIEADTFATLALGATTASVVSVSDAGGYFSSGTAEAVLQEVGARLAGFVTPLEYGAVGDGTTDDTTALQAMFDALTAKTIIHLLGKTWKYSALTIPTSCTIWAGTLTSAATSGTQIDIARTARMDAYHVEFSGGGSEDTLNGSHIIISQNGASSSSRAVGYGLYNCEVHGCGRDGVSSKWADDIRIVDSKVYDCAYSGIVALSPRRFRARGNYVNMLDAVGSSSNAYGLILTHDSADYDLDANAGLPTAENHFPVDCIVEANTFVGPKIWEACDIHGGYQIKFLFNNIYAAKHGIMMGNSSGAASNYAGYQNMAIGNVIDNRMPDGSASGVTPGYGIVCQGGASGTTGNSWQIIVANNVVRGFGDATPNTYSVSILINVYANMVVATGNIIENWTGYGIVFSAGTDLIAVNDNQFSRMSAASTGSACIYCDSSFAGMLDARGNMLDRGGTQPTYGLRNAGTGAHITFASDFRTAGTEFSDSSANGRSVSYA